MDGEGPHGRRWWTERDVVGHAAALLRQPRWQRLALATVALSVACLFLGRWQYARHEAKVTRNARIDANYAAAPVPLDRVLAGPATPLPPTRQWTPVRVTGRYLTEATTLIRNRPLDGDFGFEVVVPLRLDDGSVLMVDRGWLPSGPEFVTPQQVPAPPPGPVTVVGRLRPGEPGLDRTPPPGQELRIDLDRLGRRVDGATYRAYAVLAAEQPAPATAPTPLPRPEEDLGPHLAYAVQWWAFGLTGYVLLAVYALRESRAALGATAADPALALGRRRRSAEELSDEEWEDAAQG